MSQMYEKDGVTPWDGRNSKDPFDYGIKYEAVSLEELCERFADHWRKELLEFLRMVITRASQ